MPKPTPEQQDAKLEDFTETILDLANQGYSTRWITGYLAGAFFKDHPSMSIPWDKIHSFLKKGDELIVPEKSLAKAERYTPETALTNKELPLPEDIVKDVYTTMNRLLNDNADMNLTKEAATAAQQLLKTCEIIMKIYDQSQGKSSTGDANIQINYMENARELESTLKFLEKNGFITINQPLDFKSLIDITPAEDSK